MMGRNGLEKNKLFLTMRPEKDAMVRPILYLISRNKGIVTTSNLPDRVNNSKIPI